MTFLLNKASGDLELVNGDLSIAADTVAIDQQLRSSLRTFLGEWFLDARVGIPYFQQVLGVKNPSVTVLSAIFRREILKSPGVESVANLQFGINAATRELSLAFEARTASSVLVFSDTLT